MLLIYILRLQNCLSRCWFGCFSSIHLYYNTFDRNLFKTLFFSFIRSLLSLGQPLTLSLSQCVSILCAVWYLFILILIIFLLSLLCLYFGWYCALFFLSKWKKMTAPFRLFLNCSVRLLLPVAVGGLADEDTIARRNIETCA